MNRCITCGKTVTKPTAENVLECENHTYLVCCPLCEKEFNRDPEHYMAVAQSLFGDGEMDAFSKTNTDRISPDIGFDYIRLLRKLKDGYSDIERSYAEQNRHFDQISTSGGLKGLRSALRDHREIMDSLQDQIAVHAGVYRFVVAIAESSLTMNSRAAGE